MGCWVSLSSECVDFERARTRELDHFGMVERDLRLFHFKAIANLAIDCILGSVCWCLFFFGGVGGWGGIGWVLGAVCWCLFWGGGGVRGVGGGGCHRLGPGTCLLVHWGGGGHWCLFVGGGGAVAIGWVLGAVCWCLFWGVRGGGGGCHRLGPGTCLLVPFFLLFLGGWVGGGGGQWGGTGWVLSTGAFLSFLFNYFLSLAGT